MQGNGLPQDLVHICKKNLREKEPFYWKDILFKPVYGKGNEEYVIKFTAEIRDLKLELKPHELIISNSLHKFFKGNNYSDFTRAELIKSIELLSNTLGIKETLIVPIKMEFGVNCEFNLVDDYIGSILNYKGKPFDK